MEGRTQDPSQKGISITAKVLSSRYIYDFFFFEGLFYTNWFLVIYPLFISFLCHD